MLIEKNKAVVRRYFEEAPDHPEICEEIFAERVYWHGLYHTAHPDFDSTPQLEREAYQRHIRIWGRWIESIDQMVAEGDRVMVHWHGRGCQQEEYMGIPPIGKEIELSGIYIFRLDDGKIVEVWNLWDRLGELQQLGLLPETKEIIARAKREKV